jgi:hypothetical protein
MKRFSMFQDIFSSATGDSDKHDAVVGHMIQQISPVASPVSTRRSSAQSSIPIPEPVPVAAAPSAQSETDEEETLWFETARNGVGWGQTVVLSYVALGIVGGFIFWWQNNFADSVVDSMFMTVSAITGSSLSAISLQKSSIGALIVINILAFISSPTWSDLIFVIIW